MTIYLVIHEDRHVDVEVTPYQDRDAALSAARDLLAAYDGVESPLTPAMSDDRWIFFGTYSTEEDCIRVIEREVIS